uniref:Uncharacterized protein n=1 Tax=Streptomyces sp. NRRL F-4415 TaxID=1286194 RepID=L7ZAZ0_9ACTN|nr:hypothetical protein [Streptomyces sp. NRRL F-4415]
MNERQRCSTVARGSWRGPGSDTRSGWGRVPRPSSIRSIASDVPWRPRPSRYRRNTSFSRASSVAGPPAARRTAASSAHMSVRRRTRWMIASSSSAMSR